MLGNYGLIEILYMPVLMQAEKRSLCLSVHEWISHWTVYVKNHGGSLILEEGRFWRWWQVNLAMNERGHINEKNCQSSFEIGPQYVLTEAEYMCTMKYSTWSVTTWCKKLNYNAITKKGSENDKELAEASNTRYNNPQNPKRKWDCQTLRLLCRGGVKGIFRECTCIFT